MGEDTWLNTQNLNELLTHPISSTTASADFCFARVLGDY